MHVTGLWIHPVKSLGGQAIDSARVEPWGLEGDRRWGLVDPSGEKVTARDLHALLRLHAEQVDDETIRIHDGGESILVDIPLGLPPIPVSHARQGFAPPADQDVSEWISERVGRPLRLVWQEEPTQRRMSGAHGGLVGDTLSLADAGPVLLTSEASLAQLQEWVDARAAEDDPGAGAALPLSMVRFRPNVVIDGGEPFDEDGWGTLRIGEVRFRTAEVCDRCVMTTIDPETIVAGKEPIRTLARHRTWDGKTWFGTRLVPLDEGRIALGDEVVPGD
ncbi:mosc domain containing protein [Janibacter hoylei PVAS-1]|uniref:Mosc domain containing protein n=1 Tax=Janibacter hoylei PVAS-1 TaxID=1210046 RepID=K1E4X5_9MICO|nr:MOSC domain-containing protein [Janibacter hoylei]EKA62126.1 mosc domain containing protein [Janibacter hoylei PVAS-1]RWU85149.1 sulfurase [Janibacter hoylei PVAS-1]